VTVLWDHDGTPAEVPVALTAFHGAPQGTGIAASGWIVGSFGFYPSTECGFFWSEATGTLPLAFAGVEAPTPLAISDAGYIVGMGSTRSAAPALLWILTLTPSTVP